jgi:hypothetical protein
MNNDDWNLLLNYAESYPAQTSEADRRRSTVLIRFRQWLREAEISIPGDTPKFGITPPAVERAGELPTEDELEAARLAYEAWYTDHKGLSAAGWSRELFYHGWFAARRSSRNQE